MRKHIYILLTSLIVMSCNTVEKMVEKGQYDEAFTFSVNHLAGKKNKKTKYVTALEEAYVRLNNRDQKEISFLLEKGSPAAWDRVYDLYIKIENRQRLVSSLIPLESRDGYVAYFDIKDYSSAKVEMINLSTEYHYNRAYSHLMDARNGDKRAARRAVTSLNNVFKYKSDYKDAESIKNEAIDIGTEHIAIEFVNNDGMYFDRHAMDRIQNLNVAKYNTFWEKFHRYDPSKSYDNYVVIELLNIDLGMEREYINHNSFIKEIEDGYDMVEKTIVKKDPVVKQENGGNTTSKKGDKVKIEYITSTTKEVTKVAKYKKVRADITEIKRERYSNMYGKVKMYRNDSDVPVYQNLINVDFNFFDEAVRLRGDRRAIPNDICLRLNEYIDEFPNDYVVVDQLSNHFTGAISNEINRFDFLYD